MRSDSFDELLTSLLEWLARRGHIDPPRAGALVARLLHRRDSREVLDLRAAPPRGLSALTAQKRSTSAL